MVTEYVCHAHLRPVASTARHQEYVLAFAQLKAMVDPQIVQRLALAATAGSLSAYFLGFFDFVGEALAGEMHLLFHELLAIGLSNKGRLLTDPLTWAKERANELIESKLYTIQWWGRRSCDGRGLVSMSRGINHEAAPVPPKPFRSSVAVMKNWDDHETALCTCQEWLSSPARYDEERKGNAAGVET